MSAGAGKIAILDFGGQYTQLIARRIREMSVYSEIFSCTHPLAEILSAGYQGIILSGGPSSVYEDGAPLPPEELFEAGVPVLGICYGMQAMGYLLGGHVVPAERREYGKAEITLLQGSSRLLRGVEPDANGDRKSVGEGKRVDLGGGRIIKKKKEHNEETGDGSAS